MKMPQLTSRLLVALLALAVCYTQARMRSSWRDTTTTVSLAPSPQTASGHVAHFRCTRESCGGRSSLTLYRKVRRLSRKFKGLFLTRCDIFKLNWCLVNRERCPRGRFPTKGPEAALLRKNCNTYNRQLPPEVTAPEQPSGDEQTTNTSMKHRRFTSASERQFPLNDTLFSGRIRGDLDRCCQTTSEFKIIAGNMKDHLNRPCHVISLDDRLFQLAQVGFCYPGSAGLCDGSCTQEKKLVTLLCLEPVPGTDGRMKATFKLFSVDGYCSCKFFKSSS